MNSSTAIIKKEKKILLEKHIKKSLKQYNFLFSSDADAIYVMDLDGYINPLNPACERIFGYPSDELMKLTYMKLVTLDHLERSLSFFYKSLEGKLQNFDCQIFHKSGEIIDVNVTNYPIVIHEEIVGVYGVAKDISEIKRQRKKIQQSEKFYKDIVEHSPDAVVIAKGERIVFANDTAVHLIGAKNKQEMIGENTFDYVDIDYYDIVKKRVTDVERGKTVDFIEEKLVRTDGKIIEVEVKSIPAIYDNEPARHIIIRDITEKKRTQQLLLLSEKLTVAGQLAAGIAHEVRNPLTAIKGFLQLMESHDETNDHYLEIIKTEMNRIEVILNELLLLSKPQDMKFRKKNLKVILKNIKALLDTQAVLNNIEIVIDYLSDIPEILCDENQLKQVFINLLKNSLEAMPNGGKIRIEVALHGRDKIIIRFIDQGCGIPKANIQRIGQPFFTTKENGTGLGLMISMQIIENHQGTFDITSDQIGTTIELTLPVSHS